MRRIIVPIIIFIVFASVIMYGCSTQISNVQADDGNNVYPTYVLKNLGGVDIGYVYFVDDYGAKCKVVVASNGASISCP